MHQRQRKLMRELEDLLYLKGHRDRLKEGSVAGDIRTNQGHLVSEIHEELTELSIDLAKDFLDAHEAGTI